MNPFWAIAKIAGVAVFTAVAGAHVMKKLLPDPSDVVAGAIHFRNSFVEFQKGVSSLVFGASESTAAQNQEKKDASRIPIE
jgi:hypothetical protein